MMTWWQNTERAAGMPGAFHWLLVGFIVAAALLCYLQPAERLRIRPVQNPAQIITAHIIWRRRTDIRLGHLADLLRHGHAGNDCLYP